MERIVFASIKSCNSFLKTNNYLANGKNFRLDFLYATSANSRWPYENIWGIYLTKSQFTWMALWMAVTSRSRLQKRQIRYFFPDTMNGDYIGRIAIYNPRDLSRHDVIQEKAYVYLFNPLAFQSLTRLDVSGEIKFAKKTALINNGFEQKIVKRRGKTYHTFISSLTHPLFVDIDEWQVAIVGIEEIVPDIEIILEKEFIQELAARILWHEEEIGENYIVGF